VIHEDVLRHLWAGQYLDAQKLVTQDGRSLVVISPGSLNRGSGPDFHDGVIALDGQIFRGDIEFHRWEADWIAHAHNADEKYNGVILHVVFRSRSGDAPATSASGRIIPTLVIENILSSPLEKILEHTIRDEHSSRTSPLRCFHRNEQIVSTVLEEWIRRLSVERLKGKATVMLSRLLEIEDEQSRIFGEAGDLSPSRGEGLRGDGLWQQLLYEGIMDGLGYSQNRMPFVMLAQKVSVQVVKKLSASRQLSIPEIEALLFRVSGLLPDVHTVTDQSSKIHLHELKILWDQLSENFMREGITIIDHMSATEWIFSPTRPANFPTVRIAAASQFLPKIVYRNIFATLIAIANDAAFSARTKLENMLSVLNVEEDAYWSFHYSFAESSPRPHALLGLRRLYDIMINTILPLCSLYAAVFEMKELHERAIDIATEIPLLDENGITRKVESQLLEGKIAVHSALQQQGILELYERYCTQNRCRDCAVGRILFDNER